MQSLNLQHSLGKTAQVKQQRKATCKAEWSVVDRPIWAPGAQIPTHLDGSLAGDFGFDPMCLAEKPDRLKWYVQSELIHCRTAMMGISGIIFPSFAAEIGGFKFPEWYEAGKVYIESDGAVPFNVLAVTTVAMSNFVEVKRFEDFRNPGSQADGTVGFGFDLKGEGNGYPGGIFDPMGFSKGSPEAFAKWKNREIMNGRLAMVAMAGVFAQYAATDTGPIQNIKDHLRSPGYNTFATNGLSLPFLVPGNAP